LLGTRGKKTGKKAVTLVKDNAYERLYQKLKTKEGEKDVFKLASAREKKTRDFRNVKCIKGDASKVLVEDEKIRKRRHSYFSKLFNNELSEYSRRNE